MSRKLLSMVAAAALLGGCGTPAAAPAAASAAPKPDDEFAVLETQHAARLGLFAIDTGSGRVVSYRADERFAHCSTFKAVLVGLMLRSSTGASLKQIVHYDRSDVLDYAPITSQHVATGMSVGDLMAAAIEYSDNTAANLLLERAGGVRALQRQVRALGDRTTTVNRNEPSLNDAVPGDVRDTSVPRDLALDLRELVLGPARRPQLEQWLRGNTTGDAYIRAGVPEGWTVGDKTGSGGYGTRNDIAVVRPPTGAPIVIAIESDRGRPDAASDDSLIADATRVAIGRLR